MYVGLTRAQRNLHLSYCTKRRRAGEWFSSTPSRFLDELPAEDLRRAGEKLPADEAAAEKASGMARLKQLRAAVAR